MTRDKWIDEVLKPWKKGTVVQKRDLYKSESPWEDIYPICDDLLGFRPLLGNTEYRIEPRTVTWTFEIPEKENFSEGHLLGIANSLENMWPLFSHAIRNAKPLPEGSAE